MPGNNEGKERFISRKFILAMVIFVVITLLFWFGKLDQDGFVQILIWNFAIYSGGNVAVHGAESWGNRKKPTRPVRPPRSGTRS